MKIDKYGMFHKLPEELQNAIVMTETEKAKAQWDPKWQPCLSLQTPTKVQMNTISSNKMCKILSYKFSKSFKKYLNLFFQIVFLKINAWSTIFSLFIKKCIFRKNFLIWETVRRFSIQVTIKNVSSLFPGKFAQPFSGTYQLLKLIGALWIALNFVSRELAS